MKLVSARTATTIQLVDGVLGRNFQPTVPRRVSQNLDSYHPEGGVTGYVLHGPTYAAVSPQNLMIQQVDDLTAKALYRRLEALIADQTEQPFDVDWNDHADTLDDGFYWLSDLAAAEIESDFVGEILFTVQMIPASPSDVALTLDIEDHTDAVIASLYTQGVTVG